MAVRGVVAYDKLHDRAVGSRGKPDQPTPLMITFFVITNGESPSVWKVSISSNGGKISARKLLLTEPTNEITRSSSGISTASQPGLQREGGLFGPA